MVLRVSVNPLAEFTLALAAFCASDKCSLSISPASARTESEFFSRVRQLEKTTCGNVGQTKSGFRGDRLLP